MKKKFASILLLVKTCSCTETEPVKNILSLDAASYKAYLTATFIDYMEDKSYEIATRDSCIEPRSKQKVAMHEMFDMIAGSETGAVIASSLLVPNDDPDTMES
jgi:hypothetical protein